MFMRYFGGGVGHINQYQSNIYWRADNIPTTASDSNSYSQMANAKVVVDSDEELDGSDEEIEWESEDEY